MKSTYLHSHELYNQGGRIHTHLILLRRVYMIGGRSAVTSGYKPTALIFFSSKSHSFYSLLSRTLRVRCDALDRVCCIFRVLLCDLPS